MAEQRRSPRIRRSRSRSITAVLVSTTAALLLAIAASCSDGESESSTSTTQATDSTTTTLVPAPLESGTQLFVFNPSIGDCFEKRLLEPDKTKSNKQTEVTLLLPCELPHRSEVFDVITYVAPDGSSDGSSGFPGEPALRAYAKKLCVTNFAAYVGLEYELSVLEMGFVIPSESNWVPGHPTLGCYLYDPNNDLVVGSFRDSRR